MVGKSRGLAIDRCERVSLRDSETPNQLEHRLGNIAEHHRQRMADSEQQKQFGLAKRDLLPRLCRECEVRFACIGACPKHRFISTPDGEAGLNYLCAGYKHFFHPIDPSM